MKKYICFLSDDELNDLSELLKDVAPLFEKKDFRFFDKHTISDDYNDKNYILNFKNLIKAIHFRMFVYIELADSDTTPSSRRCIPYKLEYSCLDDAFRLIAFDSEYRSLMIFRLSEISKITLLSDSYNIPDENILENFEEPQPVEIEVYNKRNAIERFMISFSNYHKETRFIKEKDCCITKIFFFKQDYESIIDNIVAFGPTVKILSPESAVKDVVFKLKAQRNLFSSYQ
ncbi:MAG TPA: WYL domain-containing protein [Ruminococcus bromii]|nr:WYL domain-containing protein [Ruminococcus bromii]